MYDLGGAFGSHVFLGKSGDAYVVDLVMGKDPNGTDRTRYWRDALGNQTRFERGDTKVRFSPHNCQRVVGECRFTEIGASYKTQMIRINTPTRNGFNFVQ